MARIARGVERLFVASPPRDASRLLGERGQRLGDPADILGQLAQHVVAVAADIVQPADGGVTRAAMASQPLHRRRRAGRQDVVVPDGSASIHRRRVTRSARCAARPRPRRGAGPADPMATSPSISTSSGTLATGRSTSARDVLARAAHRNAGALRRRRASARRPRRLSAQDENRRIGPIFDHRQRIMRHFAPDRQSSAASGMACAMRRSESGTYSELDAVRPRLSR